MKARSDEIVSSSSAGRASRGSRTVCPTTFARSGVAVDTVERKQGRFAPFETIVFEEERHIQPVDFEEHIVGFTAVEDIVGEMHFDFAVDAVRAGESPDGENVGV